MLEARTHESALLGVLRGSEAHFIACVESRQPLHAETPPPNHVAPAHATSAGKLLLAQLPVADLRKIFATSRLFTPRASSIATRGALERELRLIRERGYATSLEEAHEDVCTVSTVIRGAKGTIYGALTLLCPRQRMSAARVPRLVQDLSLAAEQVAIRMENFSPVRPAPR
jgi:DNA-binding IclR family transcriptional regulator